MVRYLRGMRSDIGFAVKELARRSSAPTASSAAALKKLGRYLRGVPRVVNVYSFQTLEEDALDIVVDVEVVLPDQPTMYAHIDRHRRRCCVCSVMSMSSMSSTSIDIVDIDRQC